MTGNRTTTNTTYWTEHKDYPSLLHPSAEAAFDFRNRLCPEAIVTRHVATTTTEIQTLESPDDAADLGDTDPELIAGRDAYGNVRLGEGRGRLLAAADATRDTVLSWCSLTDDPRFLARYHAVLALFDREEKEKEGS